MSSLKQLLSHSGNPVHTFLAGRLPNTRGILDSARSYPQGFATDCASLRSLARKEAGSVGLQPASQLTISPYLSRTVGTAFDYRVRYFFDVTPIESLAAYSGAVAIGNDGPAAGFLQLRDRLEAFLTDHDPRGQLLPDSLERTLCTYCYLLALFEQCYRAGGIDETWEIVRVAKRRNFGRLLGLCPPACVDDLAQLGARFIESQRALLEQEAFILNPLFATSRFIGMDGDLIVGSRLIDVKTMKDPLRFRAESRQHVWQLVSYVLGDTDDAYELREAGFYLSRQGVQLFWSVEDLLAQLAGQEVELGELRMGFKTACEAVAAQEALEIERWREKFSTLFLFQTAARDSVPEEPPPSIERSLRFLPPVSRGRKRHLACADSGCVLAPEGFDAIVLPSCGSDTVLDSTADGMWTQAGTAIDSADARLCRRCLKYTTAIYETAPPIVRRPPRGESAECNRARVDWPVHFFPARDAKKWHLPMSENPRASALVRHLPRSGERASCNYIILLCRDGEAAVLKEADATQNADARLCRRCLGYIINR